ncbi:MAG: hypothetical protein RH949_12020 [Coleofasciculus sp. A1-SPW-01]|uniref:hypothetical protein n=1 Tax=Coleofasciculus sp. A1-SPW-01 TaxID=3070819 RepID=UPI0032F52643
MHPCQYSLVEDISINSRSRLLADATKTFVSIPLSRISVLINSRSRPLGDATKTFVSILLSRISALIRDRVSWVMPPPCQYSLVEDISIN